MKSSITFACGTPHGGAVDSTLALAQQAALAGLHVRVVLAQDDAYRRLPRLTGGLVRLSSLSPQAGRLAWQVHDRFLTRSATVEQKGQVSICTARDVPSAVGRLLADDEVLVVNSMRRLDLQRLVSAARNRHASVVWYLRESSSLEHVQQFGVVVDTLLANSRPLADAASDLSGRDCGYVPSVVDVEDLSEPDERSVLLAINPTPSHGVEIVLALAQELPSRRFVLQESWPLDIKARTELERRTAPLPNVEFRERRPRSDIYVDAYAQVLPHDASVVGLNRPRVALEAQFLGVPSLAADVPGLAAVTASSELLVAADGGVAAWADAVRRLDTGYADLCQVASEFARRELAPPADIWRRFVEECGGAFDV